MILKRRNPKPRPAIHRLRPRRSAADFSAEFFGGNGPESAAAERTFQMLTKLSVYDLSGLEPEDNLGDLIGPPESLDQVEKVLGLDLRKQSTQRQIVEETLEQDYWRSVLNRLLGSVVSECTWDPLTLPYRSVGGLVAEIVRREI